MRNRALTDTFEPGSTMKPFTIAAALEAGRVRPDTVIQTAPGTLTIGTATDPRRASGRRADRRAGDPEVVQRRRREDRAGPAVGDDVGNVLRRRLRHAAEDRLSRRGVGAPASGEIVAADRAGDDGVWARHLGQPRAARARLHDVRHRRRSEAGDAAQDRRTRRRPAGAEAGDGARGAPHARTGDVSPAAPRRGRRCPAIASPARPAPRTSSKATATATSTSRRSSASRRCRIRASSSP